MEMIESSRSGFIFSSQTITAEVNGAPVSDGWHQDEAPNAVFLGANTLVASGDQIATRHCPYGQCE